MSLDRTADQDVMNLGLRCLSSKMRKIMRSSGAHLRYWSGSSSMALTYAWKMSAALSLGRPSTIWSNTLTKPRAKTCSPSRCQTTRGYTMCTVQTAISASLTAYLVILVCTVISQEMLLHKQLLDDCVVYRRDRLLKVLIESLFCV